MRETITMAHNRNMTINMKFDFSLERFRIKMQESN